MLECGEGEQDDPLCDVGCSMSSLIVTTADQNKYNCIQSNVSNVLCTPTDQSHQVNADDENMDLLVVYHHCRLR